MIVASAILHCGIIFTGVRHSEIISDLIRLGYEKPIPNHEQGFIDDKGKYLNREESEVYAFDCGQIIDTIGSVLTSEDLW